MDRRFNKIAQQVERWTFEDHPDGKLSKIELRQAGDMGDSSLTHWRVREEDLTREFVRQIVSEAAEYSREDAEGLGGMNSYALVGYFGKNPANYDRRTTAWREHGDRMNDQIATTEKATPTGVIAQSMRHLEAMARVYTTSMGAAFETVNMQLARANEMQERALMREREFYEAREQMEDKRLERDVRLLKEKNSEDRLDEMLKTVIPLLPVAASKFMGPLAKYVNDAGDVDPAAMKAVMLQAKELLGSLDREDMQKIVEAVENGKGGTAKTIAFMNLYQSLQQIAEAEEEAKKKKGGSGEAEKANGTN